MAVKYSSGTKAEINMLYVTVLTLVATLRGLFGGVIRQSSPEQKNQSRNI